ncbi:MAG: metallophosphoesterase [Clostridia bacterium]|nr:metallophosphoesterase [Clostridia bacterium]
MIYLTSDLHGRMDCLMKLLDRVHFYDSEDNWLYILGDVIDRNNQGGVDILKWLLVQPNVQLILGNHEHMMLSNQWLFEEINDDSIGSFDAKNIDLLRRWKSNGAGCTINALSKETPETRQDILEYLDECPTVESVCVNDRNYLLVHGGLGDYSPSKKLIEYTTHELLWERPKLDTQYDPSNFTVILGHTPTCFYSEQYKNRMIKTDSWWNIDTGAAMPDGRPMLLCLDTLKEYYIEDNGEVVEI